VLAQGYTDGHLDLGISCRLADVGLMSANAKGVDEVADYVTGLDQE